MPSGPVAGDGQRPLAELRFLTVAEVATLMRVSKMTVYRLVHGGTLPAVRVGGSFRGPEQAVNEYLKDSFIEAGWRVTAPSPRSGSQAEASRPPMGSASVRSSRSVASAWRRRSIASC